MRAQNITMSGNNTATAVHPAVLPSRLLQLKLALAQPRLDASAQAFWTAPDLRTRLPQFFLELYSIVHGGLAVMRAAHERSVELAAAGDPVARAFAEYLAHHLEEEREHDAWLLNDMVAIGMDRDSVSQRPASGLVAALLGAQMFWIAREHPVAFLGYLSAVEGNPPTRVHIEQIRTVTGFPAEAFRCMIEHADADIAHAEELRAAIDALLLTPRQQELMAMSAFETIESLGRIFDNLSGVSPRGLRL